jgi:hypothetical protein
MLGSLTGMLIEAVIIGTKQSFLHNKTLKEENKN